MYTYRQILLQAIKIAWEKPLFWFFGFFLALLGAGNELELFSGSYGFGGQGVFLAVFQGFGASDLFSPAGIQGLTRSIFIHPAYIFIFAFLFLLFFAIAMLIIWLTIVSQSAIIGNAIASSKNKEFTFSQAFGLGINNFWPVLFINLILKGVVVALVVLIGFAALIDIIGKIGFIILFDLFVFLMVASSFLARLSTCGVILKGWRLKDSVFGAIDLIKKNWLIFIEITIILFLITITANGFLSFLISNFIYQVLSKFYWSKIAIFLAFSLSIFFFIFIQTLLTIFQWSTWAIIFELITGKKISLTSRLDKLFKK